MYELTLEDVNINELIDRVRMWNATR
jgi:hypothetical protein